MGNVKCKLKALVTNTSNAFLKSPAKAQDKDGTMSAVPAIRETCKATFI
jgi:hypothetical protein